MIDQRERAAAQHRRNVTLRTALSDLRETTALLRLQATNRTMANRRLLREIRRLLKHRP